MSQNYDVNYNLTVNAATASQNIEMFTKSVGKLLRVGQHLNKNENSIKNFMAGFDKLATKYNQTREAIVGKSGSNGWTIRVNVKHAEKELESLVTMAQNARALLAQPMTISLLGYDKMAASGAKGLNGKPHGVLFDENKTPWGYNVKTGKYMPFKPVEGEGAGPGNVWGQYQYAKDAKGKYIKDAKGNKIISGFTPYNEEEIYRSEIKRAYKAKHNARAPKEYVQQQIDELYNKGFLTRGISDVKLSQGAILNAANPGVLYGAGTEAGTLQRSAMYNAALTQPQAPQQQQVIPQQSQSGQKQQIQRQNIQEGRNAKLMRGAIHKNANYAKMLADETSALSKTLTGIMGNGMDLKINNTQALASINEVMGKVAALRGELQSLSMGTVGAPHAGTTTGSTVSYTGYSSAGKRGMAWTLQGSGVLAPQQTKNSPLGPVKNVRPDIGATVMQRVIADAREGAAAAAWVPNGIWKAKLKYQPPKAGVEAPSASSHKVSSHKASSPNAITVQPITPDPNAPESQFIKVNGQTVALGNAPISTALRNAAFPGAKSKTGEVRMRNIPINKLPTKTLDYLNSIWNQQDIISATIAANETSMAGLPANEVRKIKALNKKLQTNYDKFESQAKALTQGFYMPKDKGNKAGMYSSGHIKESLQENQAKTNKMLGGKMISAAGNTRVYHGQSAAALYPTVKPGFERIWVDDLERAGLLSPFHQAQIAGLKHTRERLTRVYDRFKDSGNPTRAAAMLSGIGMIDKRIGYLNSGYVDRAIPGYVSPKTTAAQTSNLIKQAEFVRGRLRNLQSGVVYESNDARGRFVSGKTAPVAKLPDGQIWKQITRAPEEMTPKEYKTHQIAAARGQAAINKFNNLKAQTQAWVQANPGQKLPADQAARLRLAATNMVQENLLADSRMIGWMPYDAATDKPVLPTVSKPQVTKKSSTSRIARKDRFMTPSGVYGTGANRVYFSTDGVTPSNRLLTDAGAGGYRWQRSNRLQIPTKFAKSYERALALENRAKAVVAAGGYAKTLKEIRDWETVARTAQSQTVKSAAIANLDKHRQIAAGQVARAQRYVNLTAPFTTGFEQAKIDVPVTPVATSPELRAQQAATNSALRAWDKARRSPRIESKSPNSWFVSGRTMPNYALDANASWEAVKRTADEMSATDRARYLDADKRFKSATSRLNALYNSYGGTKNFRAMSEIDQLKRSQLAAERGAARAERTQLTKGFVATDKRTGEAISSRDLQSRAMSMNRNAYRPGPNNLSYKLLGPTPLPNNGGMAIGMLQGMGIMYGISGIGSLISNIVRDSAQYGNTMKLTEGILRSTDKDQGSFDGRFNAMQSTIRNIGVETKYTVTEVADAAKFLAMSGMDVDKVRQSMPHIANIALVGDTQLGETADLMTNVMSGYDIPVKKMAEVADIMTNTFSMTNVTLPEIAESFKYSASLFNSGGIGFDEATAAIGILGDAGIKGSTAGTAMRTILSNLVAPRGKKKQQKWAEIGVERLDPTTGKLRPLTEIFAQLTPDKIQLAEYFGLFDKTAAQAAVALAGHLDKWIAVKTQNQNAKGMSGDRAETMKTTLQGLWAQITSSATELGLRSFTDTEGWIRTTMRQVVDFLHSDKGAETFRQLFNGAKDLLEAFAEITKFFWRMYDFFGWYLRFWIKVQLAIWPIVKALGVFKTIGLAIQSVVVSLGAIKSFVHNFRMLSSIDGGWRAWGRSKWDSMTTGMQSETVRLRGGNGAIIISDGTNGLKKGGAYFLNSKGEYQPMTNGKGQILGSYAAGGTPLPVSNSNDGSTPTSKRGWWARHPRLTAVRNYGGTIVAGVGGAMLGGKLGRVVTGGDIGEVAGSIIGGAAAPALIGALGGMAWGPLAGIMALIAALTALVTWIIKSRKEAERWKEVSAHFEKARSTFGIDIENGITYDDYLRKSFILRFENFKREEDYLKAQTVLWKAYWEAQQDPNAEKLAGGGDSWWSDDDNNAAKMALDLVRGKGYIRPTGQGFKNWNDYAYGVSEWAKAPGGWIDKSMDQYFASYVDNQDTESSILEALGNASDKFIMQGWGIPGSLDEYKGLSNNRALASNPGQMAARTFFRGYANKSASNAILLHALDNGEKFTDGQLAAWIAQMVPSSIFSELKDGSQLSTNAIRKFHQNTAPYMSFDDFVRERIAGDFKRLEAVTSTWPQDLQDRVKKLYLDPFNNNIDKWAKAYNATDNTIVSYKLPGTGRDVEYYSKITNTVSEFITKLMASSFNRSSQVPQFVDSNGKVNWAAAGKPNNQQSEDKSWLSSIWESVKSFWQDPNEGLSSPVGKDSSVNSPNVQMEAVNKVESPQITVNVYARESSILATDELQRMIDEVTSNAIPKTFEQALAQAVPALK